MKTRRLEIGSEIVTAAIDTSVACFVEMNMIVGLES